MITSFLTTRHDQAAFANECDGARKEVRILWRLMEFVEDFDGPRKEACQIASGNAAAKGLKMAATTIGDKFRAWLKAGKSWSVLVNRSRWPHPTDRRLPVAFVEFWKGLQEKHGRGNCAQCHRDLLRRLERWESGDESAAIPGYDHPPARVAGTGTPFGWADSNLRRKIYQPNKFQKVTMQIGPKKAAELLPSNYKTRVGIEVGEIIFADDQWYDLEIAEAANMKGMRPVGFNFVDYASACHIDWYARLQMWDADAEKRRSLLRKEFVWQLLRVLCTTGYRTDARGTTIIGEKGTAYVPQWLRDAIGEVTLGKVKFDESPMYGAPAFAGMHFRCRGGGNPRFKAPVESSFRLVREETEAFAGRVGMNAAHEPEEMFGIRKEVEELMSLQSEMPAELAALIEFPMLTMAEFMRAAGWVYRQINHSRTHHLEGWKELQRIEKRIYIGGGEENYVTPAIFAGMSAAEKDGVTALSKRFPKSNSTVTLNRSEVWDSGRRALKCLPLHTIPLVLSADPADGYVVEAKVNAKGEIKIRSTHPLKFERDTYIAKVFAPNGATMALSEGTKVLAFHNALMPDKVPVCSEDGRYLGIISRFQRAVANDPEAIVRNTGKIHSLKGDWLRDTKRRAEATIAERKAQLEHNEKIKQRHRDGTPDQQEARQGGRDLVRKLIDEQG